ncbi:MAG: PRC-barrel domain-containing protein [Verrucomicrobia bacterium]|nr:PRC-barrel domain-containing protein [Verrucomicrobiota bacterium]
MKLQSLQLLVSVLAVTSSLPQAMGAPPPSRALAPILVTGRAPETPQPNESDGQKGRFPELRGLEVRSLQGEKLGRIKAITVDLKRSRMVEVLVSTRSGFLGLNETITPVPPRALKLDTGREVACLHVSKARFDAAPKLPELNETAYAQTTRAAISSHYFGVPAWYASSGLGYVMKSRDIEHLRVKNPQGEYLGKVDHVFMDLPAGMVSQLVVDTKSMDGNGNHIIPVGSVAYNARHTALVMNAGRGIATGPNAPAARAKAEVAQARRSKAQAASRKTAAMNTPTKNLAAK